MFVAQGYSGHEAGKNNPDMEREHSIGPIPRGKWRIVGVEAIAPPPAPQPHGGWYLRLEPAPGTQTFNRDGFLIHGDSISQPGEASAGCIILPRLIRWAIWGSGDRDLEVVE